MRTLLVLLSVAAGCASAKDDNPPAPVHEIVSGGAQLHGGGVRMEVTVGRAAKQKPMTGSGSGALQPATVVNP
ncbi:MAG TPA: hypothetical protein VGM88_23985 [Kofleriaceae bacterium]|jgi:hypothetical protein